MFIVDGVKFDFNQSIQGIQERIEIKDWLSVLDCVKSLILQVFCNE